MNKKNLKRIISMVLLLSMMFSTVVFAAPFGQEKMPPGQAKKLLKYEEAFQLMKEMKIMLGDGLGDYRLNDFVRRGDITVMIVRAFKLNLETIDDVNDKDDFLDLIDKNNYQYNFVKIAKHYNIAKGDGTKFYPDKFVTYEEAIALIERAVKVANSNVKVDEDVKLRDWYKEFVEDNEDAFKNSLEEFLEDMGIEDEDLKIPATRGDIASMLYFVLTGKEEFDSEEDDEVKIKDIVIELDHDDEMVDFDDIDFIDAFEAIESSKGSDVKYVKFTNLREFNKLKVGTLYYDYDDEKVNSLVSEEFNYYIDNEKQKEVSKITFDFDEEIYNKTVRLEYNAHIDKTVYYPGVIIINFPSFEIDDIEIEDYDYYDNKNDNNVIDFNYELEGVAESLYEDIDRVWFEKPDVEEGKLYIKLKNKTDFIPIDDTNYTLSSIEGLKYKPVGDYNDGEERIILYTAFDRISGKPTVEYKGQIIIELDK